MLGGKVAVVCGFGEVGKGCAQALRGQGCRVIVTEIDPICALQAAMEGYQVATLEDVVETADIFVTATGNYSVITVDHMARMKDKAIVGNIGHFDNEIDMAGLKKSRASSAQKVKPQYDEWVFPDGHSVLVLAEGRLLNLGCATGHPSFVMSASFSNQVLAQLELAKNAGRYEKKVYVLPKQLDEEVARLHLAHLGVQLTQALARAGGVHRRRRRRALQARPLPASLASAARAARRADPRHRADEPGRPSAALRALAPANRVYGLARLRKRRGAPRARGAGVEPVAANLAGDLPRAARRRRLRAALRGREERRLRARSPRERRGLGPPLARCRGARAFLHVSSAAVYESRATTPAPRTRRSATTTAS